ncbi:restriction endonuclease subunit S [Geodermatophilus poikilotrophus]|uniref:Type I restriction enzyme, S subunit n=1 Tax=Geodermatophilus poikilotrophus TaxID=1333667 RepID=A0A1I0E462_9ACTN|nr:restriction endonuclease subunit S [Geodermatophilus poikilotrophus]SET39426.1 type I restriction enzyme, S subunit [Geodermatophilus poikilotrophus]
MTIRDEFVTAGDVGIFRGGSGFPTRFQGGKSGKLPFFKVSDMNSPGNELFIARANNYISESQRKVIGAVLVPKHAIVFAKVGAAVFLERKRILPQASCIDNNMAAFVVDRSRLDVRFAHYLLSAFKMSSLVATTALPSLNGGQLRAIPLWVPKDLDEQRRVAEALADADDLTSTLRRLIAKKQKIKQGMMQQLLTGRTRLPGFSEEWVDSSVGSLARVMGGGTPSTRVSSFWGGEIPWFTPAEIRAGGSGLVSLSERTITPDGLAHSAASLLPVGTVLVTSRASIGNCAVAAVPVTTNQGFTSMAPKDQRSTWFLYYWTQQNRSELELRAAGSTFLEISASKVAAIPLLRPGLDEQAAIGAVIRDADLELDMLADRLIKAREIKTGMMQQLLTGRTRLPVEAAGE